MNKQLAIFRLHRRVGSTWKTNTTCNVSVWEPDYSMPNTFFAKHWSTRPVAIVYAKPGYAVQYVCRCWIAGIHSTVVFVTFCIELLIATIVYTTLCSCLISNASNMTRRELGLAWCVWRKEKDVEWMIFLTHVYLCIVVSNLHFAYKHSLNWSLISNLSCVHVQEGKHTVDIHVYIHSAIYKLFLHILCIYIYILKFHVIIFRCCFFWSEVCLSINCKHMKQEQ